MWRVPVSLLWVSNRTGRWVSQALPCDHLKLQSLLEWEHSGNEKENTYIHVVVITHFRRLQAKYNMRPRWSWGQVMYLAGSLRKWVITNLYPLLRQQDKPCIQIGKNMDNMEPRRKCLNLPWQSEKHQSKYKLGLKTFTAWIHHNEHFNLIAVANAKLLSIWLSTCTAEARRADDQPYPPRTPDNILSGLLHTFTRYLWRTPCFKKLLATSDNVFKSLRTAVVGVETKSVIATYFYSTFPLKSTTSFLGYMRYYSPCIGFITHQILSIAEQRGTSNTYTYV